MRGETGARRAGLLLPLFSMPSRESWGIGEFPDLARVAGWMKRAGLSVLQLLPLNEMPRGQSSPYSALSAMALDPLFIAPPLVPEIASLGGEDVLTDQERASLARVRGSVDIDYDAVRALKHRVLRAGFDEFARRQWKRNGARAKALRAFIARESWWLDDYALFRAIHEREGRRFWREWDDPLRERRADAMDAARRDLATDVLYHQYLQWIAAGQWSAARASAGIAVHGDFPFMVSVDSADVWARQQDFRLDASVGAPPDAFSKTGQNWGFPAYRWTDLQQTGYEWLRARVRRSAELYDGFRVDHLVGFFRTWVRESDGTAAFVPAVETEQVAQGARLLEVFRSGGAHVIAEDLGLIPDVVREVLREHGVPGYKVLRWERDWDADGQPFRDPRAYPPTSVATSGTHDTETIAEWWDTADVDERHALSALLDAPGSLDVASGFGDDVRDALLAAIVGSGSDLALLPVQDVFGWRDRINTPARVNARNWRWRLPWPVEDLQAQPDALERAAFLRRLNETAGRR